jgi:hypothetical protein
MHLDGATGVQTALLAVRVLEVYLHPAEPVAEARGERGLDVGPHRFGELRAVPDVVLRANLKDHDWGHRRKLQK